jgi:hypothetical protein
MEASAMPTLQYKILPLAKVQVESTHEKRPLSARVRVNNRWYTTTQRFWTSFFARFGISDSIFKYYAHQEVFDRICQVKEDTELRFCIDGTKALAISNPKKPLLHMGEFDKIIRKFRGESVEYTDGVITSTYTPNSGEHQFKIGPDEFANRYMLETPMDGYGKPSIYLSLLRQVCFNGAVAYAPAFRTDITVGDDPEYNLNRALESFDSDEGYSAMRQRFEMAQFSPASLWECMRLYKVIKGLQHKEAVTVFDKVVGDIYNLYGVANLDAISEKKLRLLPAKNVRVYDLLNLASEVSTHHTNGMAARKLEAWLGTTISGEFDLEGTDTKRIDCEGKHMPQFPPAHSN